MADTALNKSHVPLVYIKPSTGWTALNLRDLWVYRELVYFLIWRDIKVRYKQTLLGIAWVVIQPLLTMLLFTFLFGRVAKMPSDGIPYPIFSYCALLPWSYFSGALPWGLFSAALNAASRSLTANHNMITKIYFPRLVLPLASVLAGLVDFAIAFIILFGLMFYYQITPTVAVWTLPFFLLLTVVTALGVALWLSAVNVRYRDVGYALPFLTQFWFFVTPIAYSSKVVSEKWLLVYSLNPMAGVVNGFRWALLGTQTGPDAALAVSIGIAILVLVTGLFYFRGMERTFADTI
jgi:lipopolysaccharide transport system permease protein